MRTHPRIYVIDDDPLARNGISRRLRMADDAWDFRAQLTFLCPE
jgi:hypothetical protein